MTPTVFWPTLLGLLFLGAGLVTYWPSAQAVEPRDAFGLAAFGPPLVAAALAAFAGEHFTAGPSLATLVPKWMPGRLFIAYFVGVAHLAAASSYVARRYITWSTIGLAVMFGLFVALMDLPSAVARPSPLSWMLAARQATFSIGALALFATEVRDSSPDASRRLATIARIWVGIVLVCYGVQHLVHPEFAPGVPSPVLTAAWVPVPKVISYGTGFLFIAFGMGMFVPRYAARAAARAGGLVVLLTVGLYVPQFFLARNAGQHITAINFIFDTLLFGGTVLVVARAIHGGASRIIVE